MEEKDIPKIPDKIEKVEDFIEVKKIIDDDKKQKYVEKYKSNYKKYKDKIKEKRIAKLKKYTCPCGKIMNEQHKTYHLATNIHLTRMKDLKNKDMEDIDEVDLEGIEE
jgi:2-oxoglutarate dehydrogenase complex dehydrogenase (E1) component-like enzyme